MKDTENQSNPVDHASSSQHGSAANNTPNRPLNPMDLALAQLAQWVEKMEARKHALVDDGTPEPDNEPESIPPDVPQFEVW